MTLKADTRAAAYSAMLNPILAALSPDDRRQLEGALVDRPPLAGALERLAALMPDWQAVFESSGSGIVLLDEAGRIRRCNARALALVGAERDDDLLGRCFYEAVLTDSGLPDACPIGRVLERREVGRATMRAPSLGKVFDIVASPHAEGALVVFDDVTDYHVLAERHRRVIETASDAIVITDPEGRIAFANPAAGRLFGYPESALVGMPCTELVPPALWEDIAGHERGAFAGEPQRYQTTILRSDREQRIVSVASAPLRETGQVTGIVASLRDVTEEHRAREAERAREAALDRSEARYLRLVEFASDGIFTVDLDGRFTSVNRVLERSLGVDRPNLLGRRCVEVVEEPDRALLWKTFRLTMAGERQRVELRYRDRDGNVRLASLTTTPVVEEGRVAGGLGIVRDITDERAIGAQLLQREKLAALGQLVSGVAHELNNPLAGIHAFSQILMSGGGEPAERREALITIQREARRAAKIVSNLLLFARQRPPERCTTDLNQVVRDSLELRRYSLRAAGIEIEELLDPTLPRTWADPFQLQQVVLNLITNAEQALARSEGERRLFLSTGRLDGRLTINIRDTGPGIPREVIERIFDPFYSTKPVGEGTGLGLSISDGIVREHGGAIRVDTTPGAGASFQIELPLIEPPEGSAQKVPAAPPVRPRRLLIVDDEEAIRAAVSLYLRREGHHVDLASSGSEALELLAGHRYDAILLDLRMPELSGRKVYATLVESDPEHAGRVVFLTGEAEAGSLDGIHYGGRPCITKPFALETIGELLCAGED